MHPQVVQPNPGNCPICGMKLTPIRKQDANSTVRADGESAESPGDCGRSRHDPKHGDKNSLGHTGSVAPHHSDGRDVDYDETALAEVSTKFSGWVEKLYVDTTGKQMHRGEPLFEIYSPELYIAQREYLLALDRSDQCGGAAARIAQERARPS